MALGVTRPPPRPWGCFGHPHGQESGPATPKLTKKKKTHTQKNRFWAFRDGPYATPLPLRWSGYPKRQEKKKKKRLGAFGGGQTTPKGLGGLRSPPMAGMEVDKATPGPLGGLATPKSPKLFFFFFGKFGGGRTTPMALGVVRSLPKATPVPLSLSLSLSFNYFYF
jgi:hypothetical protein